MSLIGADADVGDGLEVNVIVGAGEGVAVGGSTGGVALGGVKTGDARPVDVGASDGVSVSAGTGVVALDSVETGVGPSVARDVRVDARVLVGVELAVGTTAGRDCEVSWAPTPMNTKKSIAKTRRRLANHNSAGDTASWSRPRFPIRNLISPSPLDLYSFGQARRYTWSVNNHK